VAWLVAAFTLASTVMLPLYGRLCDALGAKQVFLGAIVLFLVGSVLCGTAQTMEQLIAFRAVQGAGAGGLMSVTMVVIAHLKEPGDTKGPGALGGLVAGFGMGVGPYVGGLLAEHADWRWIFYINLPLGLAILGGALWAVRIPRSTVKVRIDFAGAALAAAFAGALLLVCQWGGKEYAWGSSMIIGLIAVTVAAFVLFLWRQATAAEPILPLSLFRIPAVRTGYLIQGLAGVAMMGSIVYLMMYLQVARGVESTDAGAFLAFMALGLVVSGVLGSRYLDSVRTSMVVGTSCVCAALALLALSGEHSSLWLIRAELVLLGAGFGQLLGKLIMVVQQAAPPSHLGVATTGIRFFQMLGGTLGAALFGSLLARVFSAKTGGLELSEVTPATTGSFVTGIDFVFAAGAAVMLVAVFLALRLREPAREFALTK
jgi:MFS family permease